MGNSKTRTITTDRLAITMHKHGDGDCGTPTSKREVWSVVIKGWTTPMRDRILSEEHRSKRLSLLSGEEKDQIVRAILDLDI